MMAPDLITVTMASVFCVAFCLVILTLVVVFYRNDPPCCRFRPHRTEHYTDDSFHYHSRHSLMGITYNEHSSAIIQEAAQPQLPSSLFIIGKPNDYHMEGPLPRLPSYDSVCKKDRQRQIHSMIAQRFGLSGGHDEPPPTYEETFRQSLDIAPVDPQLGVHLSVHTQDNSSNLSERNSSQSPTALQDFSSSYCPAQSSRFLSL